MHPTDLLKESFYGNGARAWLTALVIVVAGVPLLMAVRRTLVRRLGNLTERTSVEVDDLVVELLRRTHGLFLLLVALFAASYALTLPPATRQHARTLLFAGLIVQLGVWGNFAIRFWRTRYAANEPGSQGTVAAISFMARLALWALVLLLLLDNFGLEVTALITTLGVSGIAVALAAQSVLGDLLAAISIFLDKPFVAGDFIIVDSYLGTIQSVGLRSTRILSLSGELIVMSNSDLLKSRIRNYKEMKERRVVFSLGVRYGTSYEKVALVSRIIREAIEGEDKTRFDRAHFKGFGESSLDFEAVYYVLSDDYTFYMDRQQGINLTILRRFEEEGIAFAHPIRMTTLEPKGALDGVRAALPSGASIKPLRRPESTSSDS